MSIDDRVNRYSCNEPGHAVLQLEIEKGLSKIQKKYEKQRTKVLSTPFPKGGLIDKIKFYADKEILKFKYKFFMWSLEEKAPIIYKALTSLGLPKPY